VAVITRWSTSLGGVTSSIDAVGHEVSLPAGTSEYPTLKYADCAVVKLTVVGAIAVKL
jgi:uncharacterized membrane protein YagU involved in acid resistance